MICRSFSFALLSQETQVFLPCAMTYSKQTHGEASGARYAAPGPLPRRSSNNGQSRFLLLDSRTKGLSS